MMAEHRLHPPAFTPLPLGAVRPRGWLHTQLQIQAHGLSGALDRFWPDIRDSAWFGGHADGWERAPYWLDGALPLACLLDDAVLRERVDRYIDTILANQDSDGWLGPKPDKLANHDIWPLILVLKPLMQAYDVSADPRLPAAIVACLRCINRHIDRNPLTRWAMFRWFEALVPLLWLYERSGEAWLLDMAYKLRCQGFDWLAFFRRWPLTEPTARKRWSFMGHVVNNAMVLKAPALWWRISGDADDRAEAERMAQRLDRHHGMVTGVFTGDECLAGREPTQGTELCAVVEHMYSLELLAGILGETAFADRLERIAFNALPATFSPDMWTHQYDQQVNQIACVRMDNPPWNTNTPDANIFGLEPNYGCCTANLSQGWPKFAAHLWMADPNGGLAAVAYAPSRVTHTIHGVTVNAETATDYPFGDTVSIRIQVSEPTEFALHLRIPSWSRTTAVTVGGEAVPAAAGTYCRIHRRWNGETDVALRLDPAVDVSRGAHNAVRLTRGSLVFALPVPEIWTRINADIPGREPPHCDYEVRPTGPWNYAPVLDPSRPDAGTRVEHRTVGGLPFSPEGAPIRLRVDGRRVSTWQADGDCAAAVPEPGDGDLGPIEPLALIPYGCTNLRIAEFPSLRDGISETPRAEDAAPSRDGVGTH